MAPVGKEGPFQNIIACTAIQILMILTLQIHRKKKKPICLYDDPYVSDLGLTTYDDEKGQQFLRDQNRLFINYNAPFVRRPYSPDYDSEFVVTPRHSDSEWED